MKEINKFFFNKLFICLILFNTQVEGKILSIGKAEAKVTVKVFSSLTCPHCASFHNEVFNQLKKDFIDKGLVRFEHYAFPLDLAALNAEIIVRCHVDKNKNFELLEKCMRNKKYELDLI